MPYTFDFEDGTVRAWHLTAEGAESEIVADYRPALFVAAPPDPLAALRDRLERDPKVRETTVEERYTSLRDSKPSRVLRVALERVDEVRTLATEIRTRLERDSYAPGTYRLFDVDLSPGFRYCLDERIDPTPDPPGRDLRTLRIGIDERALADRDVSALWIDGDRVRGEPSEVCWSLARRLEREDPDVLVTSDGDLLALLRETAAAAGLEGFRLGRAPESGPIDERVGDGARVPGRAVVDESEGFLWHQSGLEGLLAVVERSRKPLAEAARASIGGVLTAMQIDRARREGVLAPWNAWEPESFKDVATLHAADRGGFTFAPEVGFHEDVHELDFASLYPRIICRHNVSPETIDCDCCPDGERVPELGYRLCEERGFLPGVLKPLLDDRAKYKRELRADPPDDEAARLRARSGAIKWVLVACFGYQGYRNAKFGRIECHEAINAFAREILLRAKERLETAGWRIVHGIVDSLWVTPRVDDPEPLADVADAIGRDVGIELERDGRYEWACFVPRRGSSGRTDSSASTPPESPSTASAGSLTNYFGKREGGGYAYRGLECRRRSTAPFVADCQREFVAALDEERDPAAVCDLLGRRLGELRRGAVDPGDLAITKRVSRPLEAYRRETRLVGALRRYADHELARRPGESVEYVVVDDDARRTRERVRLAFEIESSGAPAYDADFYADRLIRACESVVSPLGWDRARIRRSLRDGRTVRLSSFE